MATGMSDGLKGDANLFSRRQRASFIHRKNSRAYLFGSAANNPERKTRPQREIDATDRQFDQLVCELYGLMEDRRERFRRNL